MTALAASNPRIRRLRRLSGRRSARHEEGAFVLEGPTLVAEALSAGVALESVFVETGVSTDVVDAARLAGVAVHEVEPGVIAGITDAVTPRPILATAAIDPAAPAGVLAAAVERGRPVVLLVEVADPGNLGTILRAADAAGCAGVVCSRGTVDPWSPKAVRSSAGAILHVPVAVDVDPVGFLSECSSARIPMAATVVDQGTPLDRTDLSGPSVLVLGSEAHGVPAAVLDQVDLRLTIPMEGRAESLNVAMAASVLVFEAMRQRRAAASADAPTTGARLDDPAAQPIGRLDPPATQ